MTTRFANLLIDTADRLAESRDGDDAWNAINAVAGRLGANAVNGGMFLKGTDHIAWMRSTMAPGWLEEYAGDGLFAADPLLKGAIAGAPPPYHDVAGHMPGLSDDARKRQLYSSLLHHGYRYFLAQCWFQGVENRCLVLSCEDDPTGLFGPGTARAFSAVSAMLSLGLHPPGKDDHDSRTFGSDWQALSPRETDILCLLAQGLTDAEIAERTGLGHADIPRLVTGAVRKMRAHTRDQALALAMTRGLLRL